MGVYLPARHIVQHAAIGHIHLFAVEIDIHVRHGGILRMPQPRGDRLLGDV